jgi:SAM-dependent methyltransferase
MGRWSRRAARDFVAWLQPAPGLVWLDVGCGTGALSSVVAARAEPAAVVGVDSSPSFVAYAHRHVDDRRARFEIEDARHLTYDSAFDIVVSGLMLNFATDAAAVAARMRGAVRPAGAVAAYIWDYAGRMDLLQHFWEAARTVDPTARALDEGVRFASWDADHLATLWHDAGLRQVRTTALEVVIDLPGFDDYWLPFLGGQGPAPSYLARLDATRRAAVREAVRTRVPIADDGSLSMSATAWAVQGVR